ncbi:hypothetical protein HAU17_03915 [Weissella confusa]|uniref:hypothetical protein n=1 Tax=Weissella confusa TaxID=1583 RepID=UPI0018F1B36E|nr:hypothetical protein [Weissella confusa]MBJ7669246.1 hypothetical protein [Weissella confusa]
MKDLKKWQVAGLVGLSLALGGLAVDGGDGIVSGFTSGISQSGVVIKYVDVRTGKEIAPQGNASIRPVNNKRWYRLIFQVIQRLNQLRRLSKVIR